MSPHAKDGRDMTEYQEDHREPVVNEPGHRLSESATRQKRPKGFLNPRIIKLFSFMTMSICIVGSVFVSILAIWDFTKSDVWYRSLATLAVIAIGTAIFAVVNEKFGD
jgi:magnesium-transporting ATPase (P-type)